MLCMSWLVGWQVAAEVRGSCVCSVALGKLLLPPEATQRLKECTHKCTMQQSHTRHHSLSSQPPFLQRRASAPSLSLAASTHHRNAMSRSEQQSASERLNQRCIGSANECCYLS